MCDAKHFDELRAEHHELEDRVNELERTFERTDERLDNLLSSVTMLSKCVYGVLGISFLVLLCTVVYGAVGEKGLHVVSDVINSIK